MFLNKSTDKLIFGLLLVLSSTSYAGFTVNKVWTVPSTQQCDNWDHVAYTQQAVGVLQPRESMKVRIAIPEGAISVDVSSRSHASEPSIVYTMSDYSAVCYSADVSLCPVQFRT